MNEPRNEKCVQQDVHYIPVQMVSGPMTGDDVDLYELCSILWAGRWIVVGVFLVSMMLASMLVFFVITPKFKAIAVIRATEFSQSVIEDYLGSVNFKRRLVDELDLLPHIFEKSWDSANKTWKKNLHGDIPTIQKAVEADSFPFYFSVDKRNKLISIFWEGNDPGLAAKNLEKSLDILSEYILKEHVTDYQVTIRIIQEEFEPLVPALKFAEEASFKWDINSVEQAELLNAYAILKNKLADQRTKDVLSRKFSIISTPGPPSEPFKPKRFMILSVTAIGSLFFGILAVFVRAAVRRAKAQRQAVAA